MSKTKRPLKDTVEYRCGRDLARPDQPVIFDLVIRGPKGEARLPTIWSVKDAEEMGCALLRNAELARRELAARQATAITEGVKSLSP